jgi:hypothetical protein
MLVACECPSLAHEEPLYPAHSADANGEPHEPAHDGLHSAPLHDFVEAVVCLLPCAGTGIRFTQVEAHVKPVVQHDGRRVVPAPRRDKPRERAGAGAIYGVEQAVARALALHGGSAPEAPRGGDDAPPFCPREHGRDKKRGKV